MRTKLTAFLRFAAVTVALAITLIPLAPSFLSNAAEPILGILDTELANGEGFGEGDTAFEEYSGDLFTSSSRDYSVSYSRFKGRPGLFLTGGADGIPLDVTASKKYDTFPDTAGAKEIFFQVFVLGDSEDDVTLTLTLKSKKGTFTASGNITIGNVFTVVCPVYGFEGTDSITEISFSFSSPGHATRICVSSVFANKNFGFSYRELFTASSLSSDIDMVREHDGISLYPGDGKATLSAELSKKLTGGKSTAVRAVISGADSGNVTLAVFDREKNSYSDIATLTLFPDETSYTFMFPASESIGGYRLSFSAVAVSDTALKVRSVSFEVLEDGFSDTSNGALGSITDCTVVSSEKSITVSGTLTSSAAVDHVGKKLGVYAVDMNDRLTTDILATIDISTVFEITADISSLRYDPYLYSFGVAILDGENVIPISDRVYPTQSSSTQVKPGTVIGIQGKDPSVSFRSNTGQTVVDVDIGMLYSTDPSGGRVHSYGGKSFYINNSYVGKLDSAVNFQLSCGLYVYLRILNTAKNGSDAVYETFDLSDPQNTGIYGAMLSFLTERYSTVAGIILGSRIDSYLCNYGDFNGIFDYCRNYAELLRLTSVIAHENTSNAIVIVPFGDGCIYGDTDIGDTSFNPVSGMGEYSADPLLVSEILSQILAKTGSFRWYVMYECENGPIKGLNSAYRLYTQLTQGNGATPSGYLSLWQPKEAPSSAEIVYVASSLTELATTLGARAAIISLTETDCDESEFCYTVRNMDFSENSLRQNHRFDGTVEAPVSVGNAGVDLWDFEDSFSTGGFVFGGSASGLTTEISKAASELSGVSGSRALRTTVGEGDGDCAVIYSKFDTPISLSAADHVDVALCIGTFGETGDTAPVKIIFGKGNLRYEFGCDVPKGETVFVRCPIDKKEIQETVDYIAIALTDEANTSFDIMRISAVATGTDSVALSEKLFSSLDRDELSAFKSKEVLTAVAVVAVTLLGYSVLSIRTGRHDKKAKKQQQHG